MTHEEQLSAASRILTSRQQEWCSLPGVTAAGIVERDGRICIRISTTENPEEVRRALPGQVDGIPVLIEYGDSPRLLHPGGEPPQ